MSKRITEASSQIDATPIADKPGKFLIQLITPGQGSSGFYSEAVLKQAAKDKIFGAGTRMMADHPTWAEAQERPEGSIKDWAATLTEDAYWDGAGLAAEAEVYSPYAALLGERKDYLGVSIRAAADVSQGTIEGRNTRIIDRLIYGESVDFVTMAGRGGRVKAILESARNLVSEAPSNDRRDQLQRAVTDAHTDRQAEQYAWVRDFDEAALTVYYGTNDDRTFGQTYEVGEDDRSVTLTGDPIEVRVITQYQPLTAQAASEAAPAETPAGTAGTTTTSSHKEMNMPQIEEARLSALEAAEGRVPVLEAERDTEKGRATRAESLIGHLRVATERVLDTLAESALPAKIQKRVLRDVTADLPVTESGELDTAALDAKVKESVEDFESLLPAAGGRVTGFGESAPVNESTGRSQRPDPWASRRSAVKGA